MSESKWPILVDKSSTMGHTMKGMPNGRVRAFCGAILRGYYKGCSLDNVAMMKEQGAKSWMSSCFAYEVHLYDFVYITRRVNECEKSVEP